MLEKLGLPPSDKRARDMSEGDFLYCYIQILLDEQEGLRGFGEAGINSAFDPAAYFEQGGGIDDHKTDPG